MPEQPIEILLGAERREQGLRPGVVVGIVERLHRDLQQHLMALRAGALHQLAGIGAVRRKRQRHRRRQFHDGIGGLGSANPEAADDDRDAGILAALGALGVGARRIGGEGLQPSAATGSCRNVISPAGADRSRHQGRRGVASALSGARPKTTTSAARRSSRR